MMPAKPFLILLAALFVHLLPGCAGPDLPDFGRCPKHSVVRPTHAPKDFVLKEFPGAQGFGLAVAARPNGDILLAGALKPGTSDLGGGPHTVSVLTAFIASFDASGHHQWDRLYPEAAFIRQIAVDPEGNILAAASIGNLDPATDSGLFLKLDPSGGPLWTKAWPGVLVLRAFDVDGCGDVFLTGISDAESRAALGVPGDGVFVAEYDPSGDVLWGENFGGTPPSLYKGFAPAIALDDQGEILLAGGDSDLVGADTPVILGDGVAPDYLAKLTATGDLTWQLALDSLYPSPTVATNLYFGGVDAAGKSVVITEAYPQAGPPPSGTPGPAVLTAHWIDPSGHAISKAPLAFSADTQHEGLEFISALVAPSGSVLVARGENGPTDTWMVELDAGGSPIWSLSDPSNKPGGVLGIAFDGSGRPLAAGAWDDGGLFLGFDASPP